MSIVLLLVFIALFTVGLEAQIACSDQLHNYYVAKGLSPGYPVLPVILFSVGVDGSGVPYVTVTYQFEMVARTYHESLNLTGTPYVSYVTYDKPWCLSTISDTCALDKENHLTLAKNTTCPITDFDLGGTTDVAGRYYSYANQTIGCNGSVTVTFYNATLLIGQVGNYIYDAFGITNTTLLNPVDALFQYRSSGCDYATGYDVNQAMNQGQFVCYDIRVGCSTPRPSSLPTKPVIPVGRFACFFNNITFNSSGIFGYQYMLWQVISLQVPQGQDGLYQRTTLDSAQTANYYGGRYDPLGICWYFLLAVNQPVCKAYILLPSTSQQIQSPYGYDFDSSLLLGYELVPNTLFIFSVLWQAQKELLVTPSYTYSDDPIIEMIPCICQFSMYCKSDGVTVDTDNFQHFLDLKNRAPVSVASPRESTIAAGTPTLTLYSNRSYDPDQKPAPFLTYYWRVYNISNFTQVPYAGTPMIPLLTDPTSGNATFNTSDVMPGFYQIILYVSDGDKVTFSFANLTILANIVTAVCPNDFAVKLVPCNATHPSTCITLSGALTFESDTSFTIYYNWTQMAGYNLWPMVYDNTTCNDYISALLNYSSRDACLIPRYGGTYEFNLTAYDGYGSISSCVFFLDVIPGDLDHVAPPGNPYLFTPPPPRTDPPLGHVNFTFPLRTGPPINAAPFLPLNLTDTQVPTLFPSYPPATNEEFFTTLLFFGTCLAFLIIFVAFYIALAPEDEYNWRDRIVYKH